MRTQQPSTKNPMRLCLPMKRSPALFNLFPNMDNIKNTLLMNLED